MSLASRPYSTTFSSLDAAETTGATLARIATEDHLLDMLRDGWLYYDPADVLELCAEIRAIVAHHPDTTEVMFDALAWYEKHAMARV